MNLKILESYLRVNLLGMRKKNLPVGGLTKVEKHSSRNLKNEEVMARVGGLVCQQQTSTTTCFSASALTSETLNYVLLM
jgi:hypothetical protein